MKASSKHSPNKNNANIKSVDKDTQAEKERLLRDIQNLKSIIKQCEWSLNMVRFKDAERVIVPQNTPNISHFSRIPNIEVKLQNDLYKFTGFRCVKYKKDELIFNFTSAIEKQNENTYAVQILIKDGKGHLGKWVMPMAIDMNYILTKTPIENLKNLDSFLKNCKHNIDCYFIRQEQFFSLKSSILRMKYYTVQSNTGYTRISLELYGVHDIDDDKYINLVIYLLYQPDETRPHKIEIDTTDKNNLMDSVIKRLKTCLKEFKILDLQTAFNTTLIERNSGFSWERTEDDESPLELNETSSSDEGFLMRLKSNKRKAKKKHELQKKWEKRKRQKEIPQNITSKHDNKKDNRSKAKILDIKQINNDLPETTPMNKRKAKLKQTRLDFRVAHDISTNSALNKSPLSESKLHNRHDNKRKKTKIFTSTPLPQNTKNIKSSNLEIDITNIETIPNKRAISKKSQLEDSKNSKQSRTESTSGLKINRSLRSNSTSARLSLDKHAMNRNQRSTRSTRKN